MGEIEVEQLVREMVENLSETICRQIYGAHVYCEIRNLSALVSTLTADADRKRLIKRCTCTSGRSHASWTQTSLP